MAIGRITRIAAGAAFLVLGPVLSAQAASIDFSFDTLANNANNAAVQTYMNGMLPGGASVVVTGAVASKTYTGDGHVVGPNYSTPLTLGNTNDGVQHGGAADTFIMNNSPTDRITMVFTGLTIFNISFDLEIFPDGTCPNTSHCTAANWPDFELAADGSLIEQWLGLVPGTGGTYSVSPAMHTLETAPQLLTVSGTWYFPGGVTKLEFIDWPAHIGIDNLRFNVPEPASFALLGFGLIALGSGRRRSKTGAEKA